MSRKRRGIRARGTGAATHNRAGEPGKLEVTVWGTVQDTGLRLDGREVGIVLGEEDIRLLVAQLERFGLLR